jgi:hypothetical protein
MFNKTIPVFGKFEAFLTKHNLTSCTNLCPLDEIVLRESMINTIFESCEMLKLLACIDHRTLTIESLLTKCQTYSFKKHKNEYAIKRHT